MAAEKQGRSDFRTMKLPLRLVRWIKIEAAKRDVTMSRIVEEAIRIAFSPEGL